jgi:hypothetical protein
MTKPLDLLLVARTLTKIATLQGLHGSPAPGDLPGSHDGWFDGGAVKRVTGWDEFHFADGTVAVFLGHSPLVSTCDFLIVPMSESKPTRRLLSSGP